MTKQVFHYTFFQSIFFNWPNHTVLKGLPLILRYRGTNVSSPSEMSPVLCHGLYSFSSLILRNPLTALNCMHIQNVSNYSEANTNACCIPSSYKVTICWFSLNFSLVFACLHDIFFSLFFAFHFPAGLHTMLWKHLYVLTCTCVIILHSFISDNLAPEQMCTDVHTSSHPSPSWPSSENYTAGSLFFHKFKQKWHSPTLSDYPENILI